MGKALPADLGDPPAVSHNLIGQRLGRKGQETRERILAAMQRVLDDPDGRPVTVTEVAREASVALTTLYLYFPDVADLLLSTLATVMASTEQGFVHLLRHHWPDETLGEETRGFLDAHYRFWERHARLLHMRNSFADAGDQRVLEYRTRVSLPVLDLLVRQMSDPGTPTDPASSHMATVLMVAFERVATVVTNPLFMDQNGQAGHKADYIDDLIRAEACLIEIAIRHQRQMSRQKER